MKRFVTGEPVLLVYRGELREEVLRRVRVTRDEVYAAVRSKGVSHMSNVRAVVLETDGSFSVLASQDGERDPPPDTLEYVRGGPGED